MLPDRFAPWAEQTLRDANSPAIDRIESFADETIPRGTRVVFSTGAQLIIQWVMSAGINGDADEKAGNPITGALPALVKVPELPTAGQLTTADIEAHLAALLNNNTHPELAEIVGYKQSGKYGTAGQSYGLRALCHSEAVVYGLFRHTLQAGQEPSTSTEFKQREEI